MKFSIVIPVYNAALDIRIALDSVLSQNYSDWEILLMDGLSTDNTLHIARGYDDQRIRIFSEADSGVYDAMNKGIRVAAGQWLYFLGSDDSLYDGRVLRDVADFIQLHAAEKGLVMVYGDVIQKRDGSRYYGPADITKLLRMSNICHQSIFYHKNAFRLLGKYKTEYNVLADWDFNIRCFMHPDLRQQYMDRVIAHYDNTRGVSSDGTSFNENDLIFRHNQPRYYLRKLSEIESSREMAVGKKVVSSIRSAKALAKKLKGK